MKEEYKNSVYRLRIVICGLFVHILIHLPYVIVLATTLSVIYIYKLV